MFLRGVAIFLGGFTLLNALGGVVRPGFDANLWWIDLRLLGPVASTLVALFGGTALLGFAAGLRGR